MVSSVKLIVDSYMVGDVFRPGVGIRGWGGL